MWKQWLQLRKGYQKTSDNNNTTSSKKKVWTLEDLQETRAGSRRGNKHNKAGSHSETFKDTYYVKEDPKQSLLVVTPNSGETDTQPFLPEAIGRECLRQTNEFRAKYNLPALLWNVALYNIAVKHSQDMGEKKVPFGHDGFQQRMREVPFAVCSIAENVGMNYGMADAAKAAVQGWIDSPPHRKNMLSVTSLCGIGVFQNHEGTWFFTQLFVQRRH